MRGFLVLGAVLRLIVSNLDEFPWMGLVLHRGSVKCSCVLFSNHAIAPASCLQDLSRAYSVRTKDRRYRVAHFTVHPQYSTANFANDVAILTLLEALPFVSAEPLYFAPSLIRSTKLPVFAVGWVKANRTGKFVQNQVKAISKARCRATYPDASRSQACVGFLPSVTLDCLNSCGGPIFQNRSGKLHLVGMASWGPVCGRKAFPIIYTRSRPISHLLYRTVAHLQQTAPVEATAQTPVLFAKP